MSWISSFLRGLRRRDEPEQIIVSSAPVNPVYDRLAEEADMHREATRCESRKFDGKGRSWRCVNDAGHPPSDVDGGHSASARAGRRW